MIYIIKLFILFAIFDLSTNTKQRIVMKIVYSKMFFS